MLGVEPDPRAQLRSGLLGLLLACCAPSWASILEISPADAPDAPDALRVVNRSKMPATVQSLTWTFSATGTAAACVVKRPLTLTVPPGASVLVPAAQHGELLSCLRAGRSPGAQSVAGFAHSGPAPQSPALRIGTSPAGVQSAAVELDAEFDIPQRRVSEVSRLNILFK